MKTFDNPSKVTSVMRRCGEIFKRKNTIIFMVSMAGFMALCVMGYFFAEWAGSEWVEFKNTIYYCYGAFCAALQVCALVLYHNCQD